MRLTRLAVRCTWLGGDIREAALSLIEQAAMGDLERALEDVHPAYASAP